MLNAMKEDAEVNLSSNGQICSRDIWILISGTNLNVQEAYSCKSEPGWLRIQDTPKIRYVTNDYFHQKHHMWSFHLYILCRPLYTH